MKQSILLAMAVSGAVAATAWAAPSHQQDSYASPYAGQEQRAIKTLSEKDIEDLRNGRGWGLAKAAELNGLPGPAHLLELKNEIALSSQQQAEIGKIFAAMKARAIPLGNKLIALEQSLNKAFSDNEITPQILREHLSAIAEVRSALRFVHLSAHLQTPTILSRHQISSYNRLRGYDDGNVGHHRH